jgi:hypothetical protein
MKHKENDSQTTKKVSYNTKTIDNMNESDTNTNISTDENIVDAKNMNFTSKETYYFKMIDKYFKKMDVSDIQKMLDIINGKSKISLRLFDWFITRYANKHKTHYKIDGELFYVHISYKAQLKSYKKRYFDPFRRRRKFLYSYSKGNYKQNICTTIGQLNFFRWAFTNEVIKYVEENYDTISKSMVICNKIDKQKKQIRLTESSDKNVVKNDETVEVNKNGINIIANKKVTDDKVKIILSFD